MGIPRLTSSVLNTNIKEIERKSAASVDMDSTLKPGNEII
jgi:hypothetical protein